MILIGRLSYPNINKVQVSTNITNIQLAPIHDVFTEISNKANKYGTKVTGSELIGLIPLEVIINAANFFSSNNDLRPLTEDAIIEIAVKKLGHDELSAFNPKERILEIALKG